MTTTTATSAHQGVSAVTAAGILTIVAALIGIAGAVFLIVVPPAAGSEGTFGYPMDAAGHAIMQVLFALNHVMLSLALLAVTLSPKLRSRIARAGGWVAIAGMALLTVAELAAIPFAATAYPSDELILIDTLYPVGSILIGVGLVALGIGVARIPGVRGWQRWIVLATGVALFVVVIPGLMFGFVAGRIVLAIWMVFWAALGVAVVQAANRADAAK